MTWSQAWRVLGLRGVSVVSRSVVSAEHSACCEGGWVDNSFDVGIALEFRNDRRYFESGLWRGIHLPTIELLMLSAASAMKRVAGNVLKSELQRALVSYASRSWGTPFT